MDGSSLWEARWLRGYTEWEVIWLKSFPALLSFCNCVEMSKSSPKTVDLIDGTCKSVGSECTKSAPTGYRFPDIAGEIWLPKKRICLNLGVSRNTCKRTLRRVKEPQTFESGRCSCLNRSVLTYQELPELDWIHSTPLVILPRGPIADLLQRAHQGRCGTRAQGGMISFHSQPLSAFMPISSWNTSENKQWVFPKIQWKLRDIMFKIDNTLLSGERNVWMEIAVVTELVELGLGWKRHYQRNNLSTNHWLHTVLLYSSGWSRCEHLYDAQKLRASPLWIVMWMTWFRNDPRASVDVWLCIEGERK